jgi:hypothetical protein
MTSVITQLATVHGVDLSQPRASLSLELPTRTNRWIITKLDGARLSVSRCVVEDRNCLGLELDMVFALHADGWEPVELVHSTALWEEYKQAAKASGIPVYNEQGDTCFANFTEYWARQIEAQGWLTQAYQVAEPEAECDDLSGRMPGCQSTHTGPCYGELWQCAGCGKTVCFAEGSDNHPELCDECWCQRYGSQEEVDDVPF